MNKINFIRSDQIFHLFTFFMKRNDVEPNFEIRALRQEFQWILRSLINPLGFAREQKAVFINFD